VVQVALGLFAGLGAGAIDAGLNTYVAANFHHGYAMAPCQLWDGNHIQPLIMTFAVNSLKSWRIGYDIVGIFQIVLAICFLFHCPSGKQKRKRRIHQKTANLQITRHHI
jgi:hypothetical protein